ncbi:MAG: molybdopterin molybdotransferase MoeA [Gammaproteobacteria bacterium]|nr:molybdopterin molybdotransferase MoeA [Gammaproteobacteria bacterium]
MESCCHSNSAYLTYAEALKVLAKHCSAIQPNAETVALPQTANRVLASDIFLDRDEPPVARSAMDGYAVLATDKTKPREVISVNYAGDIGQLDLQIGQAVKVMTGASVPLNADAVVMVEHCRVDGSTLTIDKLPSKSNIRQIGEIAAQGDLAVARGQRIAAGEIATIASCGVSEVSVFTRPRVAILSTGDEIVSHEGELLPHQTRDSNRLMLAQQVSDFGATVVSSEHVADNLPALSKALDEALRNSDIVITIGGVSMGDKDYLPQVFSESKVEKLFHKVAMRPGKPIWVGQRQQAMVVGLPGNPVSSFVGAILFARPIVDAFLGDFARRAIPQLAVSGAQFRSKARHDFVVARFSENSKVVATQSSGSADWRSLSRVQTLALVPPNSIINSGDILEVIPV